MTTIERSSGVLLHPTSLPGNLWAGTMGAQARRFVDFLQEAGMSLWQVLPLGPTGDGDSPYQCLSAFAGNPMMIDFEALIEEGLLPSDAALWGGGGQQADFDGLRTHQGYWLPQAWRNFEAKADPARKVAFEVFCNTEAHWLDDYALFEALVQANDRRAWWDWAAPIAQRQPDALDKARAELAEPIAVTRFAQFIFFEQWQQLRTYAKARGVQIVGDIPIFVALNSADVWAQPELFLLNEHGRPTAVAGVPPDYFSEKGQLGGNPLYRWDVMADNGYAWWIARFEAVLKTADLIRVDHFRGFEAYWSVPADAEDARSGAWVPGPGAAFFQAIRDHFGDIPIIAEDLGDLTDAVHQLRDDFELPGMKILHFAFGSGNDNAYLPHNHTTARCVVYPGTHDNNTTVGWFNELPEHTLEHLTEYLDTTPTAKDIHWHMIRMAWASVAQHAIVAMQDILGLDAQSRMNIPGVAKGNWGWRLLPHQLNTAGVSARLRALGALFAR